MKGSREEIEINKKDTRMMIKNKDNEWNIIDIV